MAIRYVAYTKDGRRVSGTLPVDSEAAAEEMLWRSDMMIATLRPGRRVPRIGSRELARLMPTVFGPKAGEAISFTRELATLLESGIALHPALRILVERTANPLFKDAVERIADDVEAGGSLSQAVARHPGIFPQIYHRLLTVGEETGSLQMALHQISAHLEKQHALGQKVRKALSYPAFVALMGLVAGFFLVTFSLPSLTGLFAEYSAELPLSTRMLIGLTTLTQRFGKQALGVFLVLAVALVVYFRTPRGATHWDRIVLRIPLVGRVVRLSSLFRFTGTMHMLLTAGLPLTEALEMAARATGNSKVRGAIVRLRSDVMEGQSLAEALRRQEIFPSLVRQMVSVGEESGTMHQNLQTLSRTYEDETDRAVSALTGMIEPAMILAVGGMVGFIAMAVLSSLYGVIGQIQ